MLKVKDDSGNVVHGVLKDDLGNLIVCDTSEYQRYIYAKQQTEIINNLNQEVSELKQIMQDLISKINKNSTEG